jgi:hypothetical protein
MRFILKRQNRFNRVTGKLGLVQGRKDDSYRRLRSHVGLFPFALAVRCALLGDRFRGSVALHLSTKISIDILLVNGAQPTVILTLR